VKPVGAGGAAWTVKVSTGVAAEASPPAFARAATRITVPTAGSGSVSTMLSPGATLRTWRFAIFAKSPGTSALISSTSSTPRRAPPAVVRGATRLTSRVWPRWATRSSVTPWGVRESGGWGSPRFPHPAPPIASVRKASAAREGATHARARNIKE
jgi:hypothetical protein